MTPREYARHFIPTGASCGDRGEGQAPANLALVKYWGKRDTTLNLPVTSSLSISLGDLGTRTLLAPAEEDSLTLNGEPVAADSPFATRLKAFLDVLTPDRPPLLIETCNTVPTAAGLASSASGYAALVLALDDLFGWGLDRSQLSCLARLGSGSACRSLWHGFVQWQAGTHADGRDCQAEPLDAQWPELQIAVLALCKTAKPISSRQAMQSTVDQSRLYGIWPAQCEADLQAVHAAIRTHDFEALGRVSESNALTMHATMLGAWPPVLYWQPETVATLHRVWELRQDGIRVFTTMDAGPNVKLLFSAETIPQIRQAFPQAHLVSPFSPS